MQPIRHQSAPIERLTDSSGHAFFGYYDLQPWSANSRSHLCHRVPFMNRLPNADDPAELGIVSLADHHFLPLAETQAWNFQQGAMLQWNPRKPDEEIFYNARLNGTFHAEAKNLVTGERRHFSRPFANVSLDGTRALSVNFSRMADFRPGYGYAGIPDPFAAIPAPDDDGIFRLDLDTGDEKLILPLSAIGDLFPSHFGKHMQGAKVLVNHITFNPSGSRFLFLARTMAMPGQDPGGWLTLMVTADLEGEHLHLFKGFGGASHYCWRDDQHILIYADLPGRGNMRLCLATDQSDTMEILDPHFFAFDGHCSYSPDKRFILYDSYPDADCYRKLLLYDTTKQAGTLLAELYSVRTESEDARCDLHPRWHRDGTTISFDSTHEGVRAVYTIDVGDLCHDQ